MSNGPVEYLALLEQHESAWALFDRVYKEELRKFDATVAELVLGQMANSNLIARQPVKAGQLVSTHDVEPSPCAPTFATSHRWSWPDESGMMRCACGMYFPGTFAPPCHIYAPAIVNVYGKIIASVDALGMWPDDSGIGWIRFATPVEVEHRRFERLKARPFREDGTPDVTVQSLGEWVGPDVQAAPTIEALEAQGLDAFEIDRVMTAWGRQHGLSFQWSYIREEWFWGGDEFLLRQDIEGAEVIYHEARNEGARDEIEDGGPDHGGIVRLGLELRKSDGVTPR